MFFHAIFIQLVKGILWMDFIIAYIAGRVKGAVIIYRVGGGGGAGDHSPNFVQDQRGGHIIMQVFSNSAIRKLYLKEH